MSNRNNNTEGIDNISTSPTQSANVNKPKDSKLRQQKLPAWQPILTAGSVVPSFAVVGLIFLPLGIALYITSDNIFELVVDYTNCQNGQKAMCKDVLANESARARVGLDKCTCNLIVNIDRDLEGDVYFYYGLSNYYQNHRRYVKSRSDIQLMGTLDRTDDCAPYEVVDDKYIAPCGAVANSMFNDTFKLKAKESSKYVNLTWENVAWPTDKSTKFRNPVGKNKEESLRALFAQAAKPPNWQKNVYELDPDHKENNGFINTDFIVWMRTAALPTFRKLWRRLKDTKLAKGQYFLEVNFNYPVSAFDGEKRFIISTGSWVGGKNQFLGVAYVVVGSLCLILAALFLAIHIKFGKSLTEMSTVNSATRP